MAITPTVTVPDSERDGADFVTTKGADGLHVRMMLKPVISGGVGISADPIPADALLSTALAALVSAGTITQQQSNNWLPVTVAMREYLRTTVANAK